MKRNQLLPTIFLLLLFANQPYAKCVDLGSMKISWQAFKTYKKTPVSGFFTEIKLKDTTKTSLTIEQLHQLELTINPLKLSTGNPSRDTNITNYFFSGMGKIQLQVLKVGKKWIKTLIKMNGRKKSIPFRYRLTKNKKAIEAVGHIDILDFALKQNLTRLNKQCFSMHEGKTWSHVEAKVFAPLQECSQK